MNKQLTSSQQLALFLDLATTYHRDQFDKGGRPYALHVLKVMHYLKDKSDDELSCIALGHDLLEDTELTAVQLYDLGASARVVDGIQRLTKVNLQSHNEYLKGVLESYDACRVKLADLRHNTDIRRLKGIREKDLQRMKKYHKMHLQITDMLDWYSHNPIADYNYNSTAWEVERDQYISRVIYAEDE